MAIDGSTPVAGPDGSVPFNVLFEGRDPVVAYQHGWHDDAPHQGQTLGRREQH